jgi:hypothetical protein
MAAMSSAMAVAVIQSHDGLSHFQVPKLEIMPQINTISGRHF